MNIIMLVRNEKAIWQGEIMPSNKVLNSTLLVGNNARGPILHCQEGLSFWGGVDPDTGTIIDVHHSKHGASLSGKVVLMPTSRGSCSGSGVLLQLARNGNAPAALVFREKENILTLGAIISTQLFNSPLSVVRLEPTIYSALANADEAKILDNKLIFGSQKVVLLKPEIDSLTLSNKDLEMLGGYRGHAQKIAMETLCLMAAAQGADGLIDVSRAHIDGCILAHDANLDFAEKMSAIGAKTCIPTTINAISVDRENWQKQGVEPDFGAKASRLADAYVDMGVRPTFTCAPYFLKDLPETNEAIGWSESNAVIYANSILGARTEKHPDYLDLFIAITGRAPNSGVYLADNRVPECEIKVNLPSSFDDAIWPMLGWLAGAKSPNKIPLITGLEAASPSPDELQALCAAFGVTSAAPMLHIRGHTPESHLMPLRCLKRYYITVEEMKKLWNEFNASGTRIDLVAIGSPHASLAECRRFAEFFAKKTCNYATQTILTVGRNVFSDASNEGILTHLMRAGVKVIPDLCWCSMTEPIFPKNAKVVMTNSGKYSHYGKGLTGRDIRFGSLKDCALASQTGNVPSGVPKWLINQR